MIILPALALIAAEASTNGVDQPVASAQLIAAQCEVLTEGDRPISAIAPNGGRFVLKIELGAVPVAQPNDAFVSVPISGLTVVGYPAEVMGFEFSDGLVEYHRSEGLTGVYAKIGSLGGKDVRLKVLVGGKAHSGLLEIFLRSNDAWNDETKFLGRCTFEKLYSIPRVSRNAIQ